MSVRDPCVLYFYISGYIGLLLCNRICWVSQCYILKADGEKGQYMRRWRCPRQLCLHWSAHGGVAILYLWGETDRAATPNHFCEWWIHIHWHELIHMNDAFIPFHHTNIYSSSLLWPLLFLSPSCVCRGSATAQERSWNSTRISCTWSNVFSLGSWVWKHIWGRERCEMDKVRLL